MAFAFVLVFSGCFNYVATDLEMLPEGEDVRVILTQAGFQELQATSGEILNREFGPVLEGRLVRAEPGQIFVRVPVGQRQAGFHRTTLGQDVRISTGEIVQVELRELDRVQTGLLVAGGVLATGGVIHLILSDARQPENGDQDFEPEIRSPFSVGVFP